MSSLVLIVLGFLTGLHGVAALLPYDKCCRVQLGGYQGNIDAVKCHYVTGNNLSGDMVARCSIEATGTYLGSVDVKCIRGNCPGNVPLITVNPAGDNRFAVATFCGQNFRSVLQCPPQAAGSRTFINVTPCRVGEAFRVEGRIIRETSNCDV